jgi:hypothetical protein
MNSKIPARTNEKKKLEKRNSFRERNHRVRAKRQRQKTTRGSFRINLFDVVSFTIACVDNFWSRDGKFCGRLRWKEWKISGFYLLRDYHTLDFALIFFCFAAQIDFVCECKFFGDF